MITGTALPVARIFFTGKDGNFYVAREPSNHPVCLGRQGKVLILGQIPSYRVASTEEIDDGEDPDKQYHQQHAVRTHAR